MMHSQEESVALLGMTLAEYAASRGQHWQNLRAEYRAIMRHGEGLTLPAVSRRTDDPEDGTVKFCLPVGDESRATSAPALPAAENAICR